MISLQSTSKPRGIHIAVAASSASRALFACWEARAAPERKCLLAIFFILVSSRSASNLGIYHTEQPNGIRKSMAVRINKTK
jgi:hypothetical protein